MLVCCHPTVINQLRWLIGEKFVLPGLNQQIDLFIFSFTLIKMKKIFLKFSCNEINKPLLTTVHSALQIKFKFRCQFKFLVATYQMPGHTQNKRSIISIDSNIIDNIIKKVINVQQEKCRTTNGALSSGTPALTGYSCEDFQSRTTRSRLLLRE